MDEYEDKILTDLVADAAKALPNPAIGWDSILAILAGLLENCVVSSAADVATQMQRPMIRIRLMAKLIVAGLKASDARRAIESLLPALQRVPAENVLTLIKMANRDLNAIPAIMTKK